MGKSVRNSARILDLQDLSHRAFRPVTEIFQGYYCARLRRPLIPRTSCTPFAVKILPLPLYKVAEPTF